MLKTDRLTFPRLAAALLALACAPAFAQNNQPQAATTLADLQGATTRDVGRYRPALPLADCRKAALPQRVPDARLKAALTEAQAYSDSKSGLGLLVLQDGAIIHEQYAQGLTGDQPLVSASMAKPVLALAIGIAIRKGVIGSIDDPLSRYLPEWAGDPRGAITIEQALQMRTGLGPSDFRAVLLGPDVGAAAMATPLAGEPGASFAYNNAVSQLLVTALDRHLRKSGKPGYAAWLEREMWCPTGNGAASLWADQTGSPRGYAGLNASVHDWARIGEVIRTGGRAGRRQVVPRRWIAAMTQPSPANAQFGYHVWLGREWTAQRRYSPENPLTIPHAEPFAAPDIVYFDGFGGQRVYIVPSRGLTIVRFGEVNMTWDDAVLPNIILRAIG